MPVIAALRACAIALPAYGAPPNGSTWPALDAIQYPVPDNAPATRARICGSIVSTCEPGHAVADVSRWPAMLSIMCGAPLDGLYTLRPLGSRPHRAHFHAS